MSRVMHPRATLPCCPCPRRESHQRSGTVDFCPHLLTDGVKGWSSERSRGPWAKDAEFLVV